MTANERKAEIMRILAARRRETMPQLANEMCVSLRTIQRDIFTLMLDYPLETVRGNGGCVKLPDWYRPHKRVFTQEQENTLIQLLGKADEAQKKVLRQMLAAFGSPAARELFA